MLKSADVPRLYSLLTAWYVAHSHKLPWRETWDRYSYGCRIMLEQTCARAVIRHYHEFLRRFPTLHKLAGARKASLSAAWIGLGRPAGACRDDISASKARAHLKRHNALQADKIDWTKRRYLLGSRHAIAYDFIALTK
jgi:adenine-specific DNA glycosylase